MQVDASQVGLGAVLLQDGRPVAYASKAVTPEEMSYANIEREMLAVVFGCLKYHHYLYGRRFVCRSDDQPLEKIHLKIYQMYHPDYKDYCLKYSHMILKSSIFQVKRLRFQMASAGSTLKTKWN